MFNVLKIINEKASWNIKIKKKKIIQEGGLRNKRSQILRLTRKKMEKCCKSIFLIIFKHLGDVWN